MAKKKSGAVYRPSSPADVLFLAAQKQHQAGDLEAALAGYGKVLRLLPNHVEVLNNIGAIHFSRGELVEAEASFARILAVRPDSLKALKNIAVVCKSLGKRAEAIEYNKRAIAIDGNDLDALVGLGVILFEDARYFESIVYWRRAAALAPNNPRVLADFGLCLRWVYEPEEAEANLRKAMSMEVTAMANNALGITLKLLSRYEEASECFRNAVRLDPNMNETIWNEATSRLLFGEFEAGWKLYEARWKVAAIPTPRRQYDRPHWEGEPLEGRRLLIHWEQGLGDTLQFIRYAQLVKQRGATVIALMQPEVVSLLARCPYIDQVIATNDPLPPFDYHIPLLS
ncbi:MAG: tetratricopeptide repeat protein, partial [Alphaproteobacteria bacterium]